MQLNTKNAAVSYSTKIILLTGLLVGTLDIAAAFIDYYMASGKNPLVILSYIASGAFGKAATTGSAGMMITGLLFHYLIAFSFTIFFFWLCTKTNILSTNWILRGIIYGTFTWIIMNLFVLKLSSAPHAPISAMKAGKVIKSALIVIGMVAMPLSFIAHKYARNIFVERHDRDLHVH